MSSVDQSKAISVIIPVKNGEHFLGDALDSVLQQTIQPAEILVIAGQSTDNTLQVAGAYPQVRLLHQENEGLADARNLGLAHSRSAYITFLDHDDIWIPNKLKWQLQLMQKKPDILYCIGYLAFHSDATGQEGWRVNGRMSGVTPGCLMARRELFDRIGRFDPAYKIGTDHDWFSRARDANVPMAILPHVLLLKRRHDNNLSLDLKTYRREMLHITRGSIRRKNQ